MTRRTDDLPVVLLGAGGHAKVLVSALQLQGARLLGLVDRDPGKHGTSLLGSPVLGGDEKLVGFPPDAVRLVNGLGSVGLPKQRRDLYMRLKSQGYRFASVIHPAAIVAPDVQVAEGVQVMAGAVVQPGCRLEENVIINSNATVEHDCVIAEHSHVAPGAVLSGDVTVGEGCLIGAGATVIQGRRLGAGCVVAAGAVVVRNLEAGSHVAGVPARALDPPAGS